MTHRAALPPRPAARRPALLPYVGVALGLALLGAVAIATTASAGPPVPPRAPWTPPPPVAGAAWAAVVLLDGAAGWLLRLRRLGSPYPSMALQLYWTHVALQATWLGVLLLRAPAGGGLWAVAVCLAALDVVTALLVAAAWQVSRPAAIVLTVVLAWLLLVTMLTGSEVLLRGDLT